MKKLLTLPVFMLLTLSLFAQSKFSVGVHSSITSIQQPFEVWSHIETVNKQGSIYNIGLLTEIQWGKFTLRSAINYDRTTFKNMEASMPLYGLFVPDAPNSFLSDPVLQKQQFDQLGTSVGIGFTFFQNEKWELDFVTDIQARFTFVKKETYSGYLYNTLALPFSLPATSEVTFREAAPNFHRGNLLLGLKASYQIRPNCQLFLMPYGNAIEYINSNSMNNDSQLIGMFFNEAQWLYLKSFGASFGIIRNF